MQGRFIGENIWGGQIAPPPNLSLALFSPCMRKIAISTSDGQYDSFVGFREPSLLQTENFWRSETHFVVFDFPAKCGIDRIVERLLGLVTLGVFSKRI